MASYDLTGNVKVVMDEVTFDSGFKKREFVVTTSDEKYPQDIKFECVKDRCALLNGIAPGQRVSVSFDIRGNEYQGRHYVNLSAWKVEAADEAPLPTSGDAPEDATDQAPPDAMDADGIPF